VTGQRVAGTQTRSNGETSQFSTNVFAGGPPAPPSGDFTWTQAPGTLDVTFSATATGDPHAWSWSFGDGGTSTRQNRPGPTARAAPTTSA
jgi:PKD repeat protein